MLRHIVFITSFLILAVATSAADMTSPADMASRTSILVLSFEAKGAGSAKGAMADDYLMESFAQQKRFSIVEREKLDKVLLEQKLTREKLTSPEHSLAIGRLLAADQVLYGSIEEISGET
jgi:curli biogenesis system outer membrane secretion channel CsgG